MIWRNLLLSEVSLDEENRQASSKLYATLKPNFIRTLRILPPNDNLSDIIECRLEEASLLDPPQYRALSYAWGSKADPGTIYLNGLPFLVTQNLLMALKHLRATDLNDAIWIDALCINQIDTPERDTQVRQMPQIYEKAALVFFWLGPEANDSNLAFRKILAGSTENFSSEWISELYQTGTKSGLDTFFNAVMELLIRECWNRVWIVQEIAFAREVIICCGSMQMPYATLVSFLQALKLHDLDESIIYTQTGRIIRLYLGSVGPVGLKDPGSARSTDAFEDPTWMLARNATTKKCSDVRDRIYGCYGLFSPSLRDRISIDYSQDPGGTIRAATQSIIEVTRRLEIILLKRRNENGPLLETWEKDLPSWVPELDDHSGKREIFFDALNPKYCSSACGNTEASCQFSADGRFLETTGILLGQISHLHERNYSPGEYMYGEKHEHIELVKYVFDFRRYLGDKVYSKPELMAFWSTLLGNFMESHIVLGTPRDQCSEAEVYHATTNVSNSIISFVTEMQEMIQLIEQNPSVLGWFKSLLRIPVLSQRQSVFLEPIYRHLDYRAFFCYQRPMSTIEEPDLIVDGETRRKIDIGVGPTAAQVGDYVVVLYGCKVPVILRPKGSRFQVIGDARLSEYMNGEIFAELKAGMRETQIFCLE